MTASSWTIRLRSVVAAVTVAVVTATLAAAATTADAAGVTTHGWMAVSAIPLVADADLRQILAAHPDQVRAGAMLPDAGYVGSNTFGEEAHWQRFIDAYSDQLRARTDCGELTDPTGPCADMVAHIMGMAAHGMGDEVWDWLFEPNGPDRDEYYTNPAVPVFNEGGAELQMDVVAVGVHGIPRPVIPDLPSLPTLLNAFGEVGRSDVGADQFALNGLGEAVWDAESGWTGTYLASIEAAMPWMAENMVTAPGGVDFAARAIAGYWGSIWGRITGQPVPTGVSITYPAPGQTDVPATGWARSFQAGSSRSGGGARNRITAVLTSARPYNPQSGQPWSTNQLPAGTMTITDRASGAPVPLMSGYPRSVPYTAEAGEHLVDVQPATDLTPCAWYDVNVGTTPLLDAHGGAITPYSWSFRTDDGAGGTDCSPAIGGHVTEVGGAAAPDTIVAAYAPGDGFAPTAYTTADDTGAYRLTGLTAGSYRLYFLPAAGSGLSPSWSGGVADRGHATEVEASASPGDTSIVLVSASFISGTVTAPGGGPRAGVTVSAYGPHDIWVGTASTTTGPDGSYTLGSLPAADYKILFHPPDTGAKARWYGNTTSRALSPLVTLVAGQTVGDISVTA